VCDLVQASAAVCYCAPTGRMLHILYSALSLCPMLQVYFSFIPPKQRSPAQSPPFHLPSPQSPAICLLLLLLLLLHQSPISSSLHPFLLLPPLLNPSPLTLPLQLRIHQAFPTLVRSACRRNLHRCDRDHMRIARYNSQDWCRRLRHGKVTYCDVGRMCARDSVVAAGMDHVYTFLTAHSEAMVGA